MIKLTYDNTNIEINQENIDDALKFALGILEYLDRFKAEEAPKESKLKDIWTSAINKAKISNEPKQNSFPINNTKGTVDTAMKPRIPNIDLNALEVVSPDGANGFRCPICNQSMFVKVFNTTNSPKLLYRGEDGLFILREGADIKTATIEEYDSVVDKETVDMLLKFKDAQVKLVKDSDTTCTCPRCNHTEHVNEFIENFVETSSEFEKPCPKCGGEMVGISKEKKKKIKEKDQTPPEMIDKCEQCGFEKYY